MAIFKKEKEQVEITPKSLGKDIQALMARIEKAEEELENLKNETAQAITKIGITRFNPFKEIGGDQSFCVALLNKENTGTLITSYYGRDLNRMYAKEIIKGVSEHVLSEEERGALEKAMGVLEKQKEKNKNQKS